MSRPCPKTGSKSGQNAWIQQVPDLDPHPCFFEEAYNFNRLTGLGYRAKTPFLAIKIKFKTSGNSLIKNILDTLRL